MLEKVCWTFLFTVHSRQLAEACYMFDILARVVMNLLMSAVLLGSHQIDRSRSRTSVETAREYSPTQDRVFRFSARQMERQSSSRQQADCGLCRLLQFFSRSGETGVCPPWCHAPSPLILNGRLQLPFLSCSCTKKQSFNSFKICKKVSLLLTLQNTLVKFSVVVLFGRKSSECEIGR